MAPAGPVIVITGPPGSGKSTVAQQLTRRFSKAVSLDTDWFWSTIKQGYIEPWEPASNEQNRTVMRAIAGVAREFATAGYAVVADGIIGPWNLDLFEPLLAAVRIDTHYVVLRPTLEVAMSRAVARAEPALIDPEPVEKMWHAFANLGDHERHVIDNGALDPEGTETLVWTRFVSGTDRL